VNIVQEQLHEIEERTEKERGEEGDDILLGMGSRQDTTSPAVTVKDTAEKVAEAGKGQHHQQGVGVEQRQLQGDGQGQEDVSQGGLQAEQRQMLEEAHHQHPQDQLGGEESKAVTPACTQRMPGPRVQASPGGTSPRTLKQVTVFKLLHFEGETGHPPQQGDVSQGELQAEQGQMLGEAHHQHPQDQPGGEEIKAVTPACTQRIPGPIVQASAGGTSPRTSNYTSTNNITQIEVQSQEMDAERDTQVWVRGSSEEDNKRYKELMDYMEEKRVEARELRREKR
jgi:hypothetical protein